MLNEFWRSACNARNDLKAAADSYCNRDPQIAQVLINEHLLLGCAERNKYDVGPRCSNFSKNRRKALRALLEANRRACYSCNCEAWISLRKQGGQLSGRPWPPSQEKDAQPATRSSSADLFNNLHAGNALNSMSGKKRCRYPDWKPVGTCEF